jgi:hypothetical protein
MCGSMYVVGGCSSLRTQSNTHVNATRVPDDISVLLLTTQKYSIESHAHRFCHSRPEERFIGLYHQYLPGKIVTSRMNPFHQRREHQKHADFTQPVGAMRSRPRFLTAVTDSQTKRRRASRCSSRNMSPGLALSHKKLIQKSTVSGTGGLGAVSAAVTATLVGSCG